VTEQVQTALETQGAVNLEFFYWMSVAVMLLIHAGFLAYEGGASRAKHVMASLLKNVLSLAVVIPSVFFVGWFVYNAFPGGLPQLDEVSKAALPWTANSGPNLEDPVTGIFFGAFALFAATTGSIMSGALIERIRLSAFMILVFCLGGVVWLIGAAWGWHGSGWLVTELGLRDVGAAGCVHMIAGFFTLGVLIHLGPRIGKYNADGTANDIRPHNLPLTMFGLMLIFAGFFGFLMGCVVYSGEGYTTIFGSPTNLSALMFNTLMGLAGGFIGAFVGSKGEAFWTVSGGLAGVISVAAGIDIYHPALGFVIAIAGGFMMPRLGGMLERRFKIDDPVGAVTVHGLMGVWSLLACGIFAAGYPSAVGGPDISFLGQAGGMLVFVALGFIPGYAIAGVLKLAGILRYPPEVEIAGLDLAETPSTAYPYGIPATVTYETFLGAGNGSNGGGAPAPAGSYRAPEA